MSQNRCRTVLLVVAAALAIVLLPAGAAFAQSQNGTLRGIVKDTTGAVIPGATVTIINEATNDTRNMVSTSDGTFNFPALQLGDYTLNVELSGFNKYVQTHVSVKANQVTDVTATLQVGQVSNTVEVTSGSDMVQTTTTQAGGTIRDQAVEEMPNATLDGSPLNLAIIFPNTTTMPGGVAGQGGSVGGNRPRNNNFTIDGVDNNDVSLTGPLAPVIQDAVSEFNLLTNMFSAEFGHSTAGQFNILTKSGTNDIHGSAFFFGQNKKMNAYDNLTKAAIPDRVAAGLPAKPRYDFARGGGTVGFPVIRDKFFLFGAYQYQTRGREATGVSVLAPTAAALSTLNSQAANDVVRGYLAQFPVASTATDTVFVNGQAIPVGTFQAFAPDYFNQHDFQINADYNAGPHQLRGRFLYDRYRAPWINPNLPLPQFTGDNAVDNRKVAFTDVWTVSSRWVNDFRLSYSRNVSLFGVPSSFANFPNIEINTLGLDVGPEANAPQSSTQNSYQALDNVAWTRGAHSFKFGFEYRNWIAPSDFLPRSRGEWSYVDVGQFVSDLVPTGGNGALRGAGTGFFAGNQQAFYGFVQDDWKVTPRLTMNLGLRYEYVTNARDAQLQNLNAISSVPGLFDFRTPKTDKNNFGPRLGIAWDPTGSGKTSIRAGAGVAYDVNFQNLVVLQLPPQLQTEQNAGLTCALPGAPAWCGTGQGFLSGGGLLSVNVPPTTVEEARAATQAIIVDQRAPKTFTWMLSVQREMFKNWQVELRYLGTRGLNLPIQMRMNSLSVFESHPELALTTYFDPSQVPASFAATAPTQEQFLNVQDLRYSSLGFNGGFITAFQPIGNSIYHGGSVEVNRRLANHIFLKGSYTFSKTIDDSTNELFTSRVNPRRPQDPYNMRNERGLSVLDRPHKFAIGWLIEVPNPRLGNALLNEIVHGWQINGNYLAESGQPITPLSNVDALGTFDAAGVRALENPNGTQIVGSDVNYVLRNPATGLSSICNPGTSDCPSGQVVAYLAQNPNARFVVAQPGSMPNAGRNILRAPGLNNWDLSFFKNTYVTESKYVQFRVELFNAFNHPQPALGSGSYLQFTDNALSTTYANVGSPLFFDASQFSGGNRIIQLALKFMF
jgi:hypothetical protein